MKYLVLIGTLFLVSCLFRGQAGTTVACDGAEPDSIVYQGEMCDYACYFPKGKYDKQRLVNLVSVLCANGSFPDEKFDFWRALSDTTAIRGLGEYYDRVIDSMSQLEIPDFAPWTGFYARIVDYNKKQFERNVITEKGLRDPRAFYAYPGVAQDTLMRGCVDILVAGGADFVGRTRKYMGRVCRLSQPVPPDAQTPAQAETVVRYEIARLHDRLVGKDSIREAREVLILTINNRINSQIHTQNDILAEGNLGRYENEFHKLFDSVRVFNVNEP